MYLTPEQIAATNKAGIDAVIGFANSQFASLERLSSLTLNATKSAFEEGIGHAKALLGAKDIQEVASLNTAAAQPAIEKVIAYSRSVYEVASQSKTELAKFVEEQAAEFSKNLAALLDKVSKNAPAGSDVAVAAVKSALATANSTYDSLSKAAKQANEIAEANFASATAAAKENAKKRTA